MFGVVIESTPDGAPAQPTSRRHRHSHTPEMASTDIKDTHTAYASQTFDSRRYWTSRDWRTSARLRLQHYLVQQQIKWLTHPSIPRPQPGDNYRVLDIGCGNAAWLTDLSPELPSANLVGIDISASLFPFQSLRPGNVILHTFDIFNDNFPPGFRNSFDLINARALITILPQGDPTALLEKISQLLKPGGCFQWVDCNNLENFQAVEPQGSTTGSASSQKIVELTKAWFAGRKIRDEAYQNWEGKFGMIIEVKEVSTIPKEMFQGWTEPSLQVLEDYTEKFPKKMEKGTTGLSRQDYEELLGKVYEETGRGGVAINLKEYTIVVAKKN